MSWPGRPASTFQFTTLLVVDGGEAAKPALLQP
jgi:hypothetical protein